MNIKTSELTGIALDWATEKAIGWHFATHAERRAYGAGLPDIVDAARSVVAKKFGETVDVPDRLCAAAVQGGEV